MNLEPFVSFARFCRHVRLAIKDLQRKGEGFFFLIEPFWSAICKIRRSFYIKSLGTNEHCLLVVLKITYSVE